MQPRQSQPIHIHQPIYDSRNDPCWRCRCARRSAHRKVNAHGIFELLVQLAALPRLGTPPMSGRQATPHHAAAKSLALRQRVLGASQSTGSSGTPSRTGRQNTRSQAASATQLPHPAGEAKRTGGGRHHRTPITAAAMSGCGDSGRSAFAFGPVLSHRREEYVVSSSLARHCAGSICPVASPFLRLLAVISTSARMRRAFVVGSRISRPEPLPRNS
jgi:hypothetical protein